MKKVAISLLVASSIMMVSCGQAPKKQAPAEEAPATEVEEEVVADSISSATTEAAEGTEEQAAE